MTIAIDFNAFTTNGFVYQDFLTNLQNYYATFGNHIKQGLARNTPIRAMIVPGKNSNEFNIAISFSGANPTDIQSYKHPNLFTVPSINLYNDYGLGFYGR